MRTDEDLLIEPHPFRKEDFNTNNPIVAEILNYPKSAELNAISLMVGALLARILSSQVKP